MLTRVRVINRAPGLWRVFDDANQLIDGVALATGVLDEFSRPSDHGASVWRAGHRDAPATPELQQPFVSKRPQSAQHGIGVHLKYVRQVLGRRQAVARPHLAVGHRSTELCSNLVVQRRGIGAIDGELKHGDIYGSIIRMAITAPPPPASTESPVDPEALIEEARRRTRRRRRRNGAAVAALLGIAILGIAAHRHGGTGPPETSAQLPSTLHVTAASQLLRNGPLTVIKQSQGHGGVYTAGRAGLGGMVLRCHGKSAACLELEYIAWSPDGTRIALGVTSYATPSSYDGLHVIDLKTGRDVQLTGGRADQAGEWTYPSWSPDGKWLAYGANHPGEIALASADGSQHRTLVTSYRGWIGWPTWSPDGTRIAFQSEPRHGCGKSPFQVTTCAIYVVRLDGTHLRLLARQARSPAWSPLGTAIAYQARCGIRLIAPNGSDLTPRSHAGGCRHIGLRGAPVWSPDGRKIAVAYATVGATHGLYVMNADGSHLRHLTHDAGRGDGGLMRPAWRPRS
jgi:hypothetical protein